MNNCRKLASATLLFAAVCAMAQTTNVVNSNNGTSNEVPYYTGPFTLSASSPIYVTTSGDVGIGTTNPQTPLHVTGSIRQDFTSSTGGTGYWLLYPNDGSGNFNEYINSTGTTAPTAVVQGAGFRRVFTAEPDEDTDTLYYQYANSVAAGNAQNWTDYMTINANPTSGNTLNLMDQGGYVGIGTTAPTGQLANNSTNYGDLGTGLSIHSLNWMNTTGAYSWNAIMSSGNNGLLVGTTGTSGTAFQVSSGSFNTGTGTWANHLFTILGSGYVGIGTTNPTSPLSVGPSFAVSSSGGVTASSVNSSGGYCIGASCITSWNTWTGAQTFNGNVTLPGSGIWNTSGNVGIGTTSPTTKLTVYGALAVGASSAFPPSSSATIAGMGTYANWQLDLQDGAGRVNYLWNASAGAGNYISSNEPASRLVQTVNGTSGGVFDFYGAPAGTAGGQIAWTEMGEMSSASDVWFSPRGTTSDFYINSSGQIGIGTSTPAPGANLEVNGTAQVDGTITLGNGSGGIVFPNNGGTQTIAYTGITCGGDYAESVNVTDDRTRYVPGDVLVIDSANPGKFLKSAEPYSTSVTGIYSTKPGTVGRRQTGLKSDDEVPMAMVGIVPTKVTAENGPIHPGDLLVTSSMIGYAMKGTDRSRMLGAVVGKALASLDSGTGVIEVVVTLQ